MEKSPGYEAYPVRTVLAANLLSFIIYLTGLFLIYQVGLLWAVLYLAFIIILEFRLISGHCTDCYYYGKTCAFGKGRICGMLFPRGESERFNQKSLTWKDLVPDFLVFILPVLAGIALLILAFSWITLLLILVLLVLGLSGNAYVRGHLACRYCKQREMGCPAENLFAKKG